jgi:hypothetical protein
MVDKIVKDNSELLTRKASNVVSKCVGNASMSMTTLEKTDALTESPKGFRLDPDMAAISSRPLLFTVKRYTWSWHPNAYPWPGLSQCFFAMTGCFFVKLISVDDLKTMGMTSLTALDQFFPGMKDPKKSWEAPTKIDVIVKTGESLYIAPGYIPLITSVPADMSKDDETDSVGLVVHLFDLEKAKKTSTASFHQISSNIANGIEMWKTSKTWTDAAPLLKSWIDKVQAE